MLFANLPFPPALYRGVVVAVRRPDQLAVQIDLGFRIHATITGALYNLSLPTLGSLIPSEDHQAQAIMTRLHELLGEGDEVLLVARKAEELYFFSLFVIGDEGYLNLGEQLVQAGLAAWLDPSITPDTLDTE